MIAEAYGIKLVRLNAKYLELVRTHRNSAVIQSAMEYRDYITADMQQKWFHSIDNEENNYALIFVKNEPIGLISGTQIDWANNITGNGGIFIWQPTYLESSYPAKASILMTDIGFFLGMKTNYIKILKDNSKAIAFNLSLGYVLLPHQNDSYNQSYILTAEAYFNSVAKFRKLIGAEGTIHFSIDNPADASQKRIVETIKNLPPDKAINFKISFTS